MGTQNNVFATLVSQEVVVEEVDSYVVVTSPVIPGADGLNGETGPTGPTGPAGADGNTVLSGIIAPTTEGINGDFYINTATNEIYGPKTAGVWGSATSIIGATGAAGLDGRTIISGVIDPTTEGENGDFYINTATSDIFGPKAGGVWPSGVSLIGPAGTSSPTKSIWGEMGGINAYSGDTGFARNILLDDTANRYTATEVEAALAEIAGSGRTTETVIGTFNLATDTTSRASNLESGWIAKYWSHDWEYVSATSIRVNANVTGSYQKGDKIRFMQSGATYKYFYIIAVSSYSGGYTTLTLTAGTDYSVANETITNAYYSHQDNPFGFPQEFIYVPSTTGWSDVTTSQCTFSISGGRCFVYVEVGGTSDTDTAFIGLPVTARRVGTPLSVFEGMAGLCQDNGISKTAACRVHIDQGALGFLRAKSDAADGTWTSSGNKLIRATAIYPI